MPPSPGFQKCPKKGAPLQTNNFFTTVPLNWLVPRRIFQNFCFIPPLFPLPLGGPKMTPPSHNFVYGNHHTCYGVSTDRGGPRILNRGEVGFGAQPGGMGQYGSKCPAVTLTGEPQKFQKVGAKKYSGDSTVLHQEVHQGGGEWFLVPPLPPLRPCMVLWLHGRYHGRRASPLAAH